MKKLLAILVSLTIVFSVCAVNVITFASTEPTVTVESVEAKAGDTVAVKVLIANNPGIWGMDLEISYDRTALTLESVENGDFYGNGDWTKGNLANETYILSYAVNSDFIDLTTPSGTLATLNFKVSDTAEAGEYNITASYDLGDIINVNLDEIDFNIVNGKVVIAPEATPTPEPTPTPTPEVTPTPTPEATPTPTPVPTPVLEGTITGATVDIGSSLTINYFADAPENAIMKFTSSSGRVTEVNGVFDEKTGYYKFAYTGINPQCMNDTIKAELVVGGEVLDVKENYSVKTYCENLVANNAGGLNLSPSQYKALKTLLADMLTYGAASQEYKDYNASNLADSSDWVSEYKSVFTVPAGVKKVSGNADADNKVKSVGLHMSNVNKVYFKMILTDDVTVKLNGKEVDKSTLVKNTDGSYTLYSDGITATQFNNIFTLQLIKDGNEITKVEYNVNAYIQAKYNTSGLENIVKALSNYGTSAVKYQKALVENDFNLEEDEL